MSTPRSSRTARTRGSGGSRASFSERAFCRTVPRVPRNSSWVRTRAIVRTRRCRRLFVARDDSSQADGESVRDGKRAVDEPVRNAVWVRAVRGPGARPGLGLRLCLTPQPHATAPPPPQARFEAERPAALSLFGARHLAGDAVAGLLRREAGAGGLSESSALGTPGSGGGLCDRRSATVPAFMRETTSAPEPPPTRRAIREAANNASLGGVAAVLSMRAAGGSALPVHAPLSAGRGSDASVPAAFERWFSQHKQEVRTDSHKDGAGRTPRNVIRVTRRVVTCECATGWQLGI